MGISDEVGVPFMVFLFWFDIDLDWVPAILRERLVHGEKVLYRDVAGKVI